MKTEQNLDPGHRQTQVALRTFGLALTTFGGILVAIGLISFFSAFGTFQPPRYFWCAVVGLPTLGVGLSLTRMAYLGSIARYVAGETVPVQKDALNTLAQGTREGVQSVAQAMGQGLAEGWQGAGPPASHALSCPNCHASNPPGSRFCSQCGHALV